MQSQLPISVCMIAGAERERIGHALKSVADWTSEIIVVLNADVVDGTDKIAESYGAKVFREPWKGHIAQKNSALDKASNEWALGLDCDEWISDELRDEIQHVFSDAASLSRVGGFQFPRMTKFCGRWIRHGEWYPDRKIRLVRKSSARWGGIDPHDTLEVQGAIRTLRGDLLHDSYLNINHQIAKLSSYTDDLARHSTRKHGPASALDLFFRPTWRFVRSYFFRLGFLDGWRGWYLAWSAAFFCATRYAKTRETAVTSEATDKVGKQMPKSALKTLDSKTTA